MIYTVSHPLVIQVSTQYNLRADLLSAQIEVESSGEPFAFRYERAYFERYINGRVTVAGFRYGPLAACSFGLLQILLETALEHGFDDRPERLFDPRVGLAWGAKYLRVCLDKQAGDYRGALARYNGSGPAAMAYASHVFTVADQQTHNA